MMVTTAVTSSIAGVVAEPAAAAEATESAEEAEESESSASGGGTDARFAGIIDTQGFDESALIEEPVIGSGNVSLWQGSIAEQMDDEECEEGGGGEDAAQCEAQQGEAR